MKKPIDNRLYRRLQQEAARREHLKKTVTRLLPDYLADKVLTVQMDAEKLVIMVTDSQAYFPLLQACQSLRGQARLAGQVVTAVDILVSPIGSGGQRLGYDRQKQYPVVSDKTKALVAGLAQHVTGHKKLQQALEKFAKNLQKTS